LVTCVLHAAEAAKTASAASHRALERDVAVGASGERPVAKVVRMLKFAEAFHELRLMLDTLLGSFFALASSAAAWTFRQNNLAALEKLHADLLLARLLEVEPLAHGVHVPDHHRRRRGRAGRARGPPHALERELVERLAGYDPVDSLQCFRLLGDHAHAVADASWLQRRLPASYVRLRAEEPSDATMSTVCRIALALLACRAGADEVDFRTDMEGEVTFKNTGVSDISTAMLTETMALVFSRSIGFPD